MTGESFILDSLAIYMQSFQLNKITYETFS